MTAEYLKEQILDFIQTENYMKALEYYLLYEENQ